MTLCYPRRVIRILPPTRLILIVQGLVILGAVYFAGSPPPVLVTLGAPQTVQTTNPKIGVHTRLTDEVEEWKIAKTVELVREMGSPWIVEYFPWAYIEYAQGRYDWTHADLVVDHARQQGLTVVARLGLVPEWVRGKKTPPSLLTEDHYEVFAQFVGTFVDHFRGRVQYIVVWNEPNTNFEWGERPVDPASYAHMLQWVYTYAKPANPDVQILAGALAPNLAPPNSTDTMNDLEYLQKMYDAGASSHFDALAIHAYGWKAPADEAPDVNAVNFRRAELYHEIMRRNGDVNKPAFITEGGWNDHPRWAKAVTPAQRIESSLRAFDLCKQWDWMEACALWAFRFPALTSSYQDYFTFVTPAFDKKAIFFEVQKYSRE